MNNPADTLAALAARAIPFLRDAAEPYEDDGGNEPLELAREIESKLDALASLKGEAVDVIVGELVSFVTHIATCHSNRDGTVTLPPSVKSVAAGLVERCDLSTMVYATPPAPQAAERLQDGMSELDRDALKTVLAMAQAWSTHYATEIRPELFKLMPKPHSDHERAIRRVSALLATKPTPSPAPQGGNSSEVANMDGFFRQVNATPPAQQPGEVGELRAEIERLNAIINTPQADDFLRAVSTEAEHQRQRWGTDHDSGKTPADWFWLIGYLAGKALHATMYGLDEKAEHHVITTAAACANWHRAMKGETNMRPGIDGTAALAPKEKGNG